MNLQTQKLALITGAGSGIGEEIALRLDQAGYKLIISGSNRDKLTRLAAKLRLPPDIEVVDLNDSNALQGFYDRLKNDYPALDIAFINAGTILPGNFAEKSLSLIDKEININLRSALHLIHACLPAMQRQKQGHIIVTSSIGGIMAMRGSTVYSASKFAIRGFLSGLQQELLADGIKVSGIYPGAIDTPMLRWEAVNGGSPLNFLDEPLPVSVVGKAFMKVLKTGQLETYTNYSESLLARFLGVFPWLIPKLLNRFEAKGEKGRATFIASRKLGHKSENIG